MKVFVTGGAGFIGSHLVHHLLGIGHIVTVLDNLSTGKLSNLPKNQPALNVLVGDISDATLVENALSKHDALVHLAAVASVQASVRDPVGTHKTNLEGSILLFDAAARLGVRRVVYASSAAVYGDNQNLPLKESAEKRPLTPYAADKLAGEYYLAFYHRSGQLDARAFRFFNVFGPRQDPSSPYSGVISIFLERARRREDAIIFGDGRQTRDFIFVEDVVRALMSALESDDRSEELPVFNVGRGDEVSLLELVQLIGGIPAVGGALSVTHAAPRLGDIKRSLADNKLLLSAGWQPQVTMQDGLLRTFESL